MASTSRAHLDYQLHFARNPSGISISRPPLFVECSSMKKPRADSSDSLSSISSTSEIPRPKSCLRTLTKKSPLLRTARKSSVAACSLSLTIADPFHGSSSPTPSLSSIVTASSPDSEVFTPPEDLLNDVARDSILRRTNRKSWSSWSSAEGSDAAFSPCSPISRTSSANRVAFVLPVPPPTPLTTSSPVSSYEDIFDQVQEVFRTCSPSNRPPLEPLPYTTQYSSPTTVYSEFLAEIRASRPPPVAPLEPLMKQVGFDVPEQSTLPALDSPPRQGRASSLSQVLSASHPPTMVKQPRAVEAASGPQLDLRLRRVSGKRGKRRPRV